MSTSASPATPARRTAVLRAVLAAVLGLATVLTVWIPNWIEVFGLGDPDHGSGAVERLIVLVLAVATTLMTVGARRAWTRTVPA